MLFEKASLSFCCRSVVVLLSLYYCYSFVFVSSQLRVLLRLILLLFRGCGRFNGVIVGGSLENDKDSLNSFLGSQRLNSFWAGSAGYSERSFGSTR